MARLAAELYPQARPGAPLAGVIYADPAAFAALLNFTGPEPVPGTDLVLTPDNAEDFLTTGQFETFDVESEGNSAVSGLIDAVVRKFGTTQLPRPNDLADTLAPLVQRGSLQFVSFDREDADLLDRLSLTGRVERQLRRSPRCPDPEHEPVEDRHLPAPRHRLHRGMEPPNGRRQRSAPSHSREHRPDHRPAVTGGESDPGSGEEHQPADAVGPEPLGRRPRQVDGEPLNVGTQQELRGVLRHSSLVDVPAGTTRVVELGLAGNVGSEVPYLLQLVGQPSSADDGTSITVRPMDQGRSDRGQLSAAR